MLLQNELFLSVGTKDFPDGNCGATWPPCPTVGTAPAMTVSAPGVCPHTGVL